MIAELINRFRVQRYTTPNLHEGSGWVGPAIRGSGDQTRVVWWRPVRVEEGAHLHVVKFCSIGPGMAHVDRCWCGETRYGVFGSWS